MYGFEEYQRNIVPLKLQSRTDPGKWAIGNGNGVKVAIVIVVPFVKETVKRVTGMQVNSKRFGQINLDAAPDKLFIIVQPVTVVVAALEVVVPWLPMRQLPSKNTPSSMTSRAV